MRQPGLLGQLGRAHRARQHRLDHHLTRVERIRPAGVLVHHLREELLVEAPPVDPDADRFAVAEGDLDDRAEVLVAPLRADVAGIDAILGERGRALRVLGEQQMAVVVEVSDHGHRDTGHDVRHRLGRRLIVDRHPHQLAPRLVQRPYLRRGGVHVGGVGVGHRLDDDRVVAAHFDAAHVHADGLPAVILGHGLNIRPTASRNDVTKNRRI